MFIFLSNKTYIWYKVLQILPGHSVGFHFFISFLKLLKESLFLILASIFSEILGPKEDADSVPL